ncbi:hypothetical protein O3M35_009325 [Rhynocoris fuscipes]|uniref:Carboxylesterase type B domain-containing protein n=1 Tax=Rhynocoris fuscipes TaxID=488301 RepID=A0AAW1D2H8_9HEMI
MLLLLLLYYVFGINNAQRYFDKDGRYIPPNNGEDVDLNTYVYNNRRYGQNYNPLRPYNVDLYNPNSYSPNYNRPLEFQPGLPRPEDPRFDQAGVQLPGVLGGWRSDIQGKQRADSPRQDTDRDVVVATAYGKVQGFLVNLYDHPFPETGFRPYSGQVERIQAKVCVFLGIPYALPPINEGRFKAINIHLNKVT